MKNILVACEESQAVTKAFRDRGFYAFSCDILPTSGSNPEWHIQGDVIKILYADFWDLVIAFPPCTDLCCSGARWFAEKQADGRQQASVEFFMKFTKLKRVAIENPKGIMSRLFRKPDQIIQPWQFGHGETKETHLWLKRLPKLVPTEIADGRENRIWKMPPSPERSKLRSKTYPGIADAMADQWGAFLLAD